MTTSTELRARFVHHYGDPLRGPDQAGNRPPDLPTPPALDVGTGTGLALATVDAAPSLPTLPGSGGTDRGGSADGR